MFTRGPVPHSDCDSQHQTRVEAGAPATWPAQPDHTRRGRRILHASSLSRTRTPDSRPHPECRDPYYPQSRSSHTSTRDIQRPRISCLVACLIPHPQGRPSATRLATVTRSATTGARPSAFDGYSLDAPGAVSLQCRFPLVGRAWRRLHVGFHSLGRLQCRLLLGGAGGHLHDVIRREDTCKL